MDNKDLFINDLRKTLDNGMNKSRFFGLQRGIPFVKFNMADFLGKQDITDFMQDEIYNRHDDDKVVITGGAVDGTSGNTDLIKEETTKTRRRTALDARR